jgi:hypothetical protein
MGADEAIGILVTIYLVAPLSLRIRKKISITDSTARRTKG